MDHRLFENFFLGPEAGEPDHIGFGPKPRQLALGVVAGLHLHFGDGLGLGGAAGEKVKGLFVAQGGKWLGRGGIESK